MENLYEKIKQISGELGINSSDETIVEILPTNDDNQKSLWLKNGSWNGAGPWFAIDENKNLRTVISLKSFDEFINAYQNLQKENFQLRLEKSIWKQAPVDFEDVWVVAMDEVSKNLKQNDQKTSLDLDLLVENIKKKYPNLFVDISQFFAKDNQ